MLSILKKYQLFIATMLLLSVVIIFKIKSILTPLPSLPIYQPAQVNSLLVDSSIQYQCKYHTIADFKLIHQNGDTITQADYKNKIYIADFFFTTCPTICPIMTQNMSALQQHILLDPDVLLLSHTVTPEIDTVAQLKRYADKYGVVATKWNLVTGTKKELYDLARKSYLAVQTTGDGGEFDMIHTENFMLIDKKRQIRGFYDGTDPEAIAILLEDLKLLKASYNK